MSLSINWFNWFCLIGGAIGAFRTATAKQFYRSDFVNQDGIITDEDRKTLVRVTPLKRWIGVAICTLIAIYGGVQIQKNRAWNPFQSTAYISK